ncbi:FAD-dependent oxidoreductase [candidate division CSSED10-310 bacterium]|uniref:FAD-dependent oxidoreductase n=1 Tax=candidate division CSSED10-310 bacterium TaxID=2855610 RepID=A0ABV6YSA3_UNCC1
MLKKIPQINRRTFMRSALPLWGGACLLPLMKGCSQDIFKAELPFGGAVKGENYLTCHLLKDKQLSLQFPPPGEHIYDVVIVGAGPSGLATAWKLKKSGLRNILVIDKEKEFGGLCGGGSEQGLSFASGAHYVDRPEPTARHLMELYTDCGIIIGRTKDGWPLLNEEFLLKGNTHTIFAAGEWRSDEFPYQVATDSDLTQLDRFYQETCDWSLWRDKDDRPAFGLPLANISEQPEVRQLDTVSMADYLARKGYTSPLFKWFVNNRLLDEYGTPIDQLSAWAGLQYFRYIKSGPDTLITDNEAIPDILTWPQGLKFLTAKMAADLSPANTLLETSVICMKNVKDEVHSVLYQAVPKKFQTIRSKFAVMAGPKNQIYHLIPDLKSSGRTEFEDNRYVSWLVAVITLKRIPSSHTVSLGWENIIHNSWTLGYINNQHDQPGLRATRLPHIFSLYATFPNQTNEERVELFTYGWEYWARLILLELKTIHPDIDKLIEKIDLWKWGHPMRQTLVGSIWGEKRQKMVQPFGRIFFGHADVMGIPVFEEATYRGVEIAQEVMTCMSTKFVSSL